MVYRRFLKHMKQKKEGGGGGRAVLLLHLAQPFVGFDRRHGMKSWLSASAGSVPESVIPFPS